MAPRGPPLGAHWCLEYRHVDRCAKDAIETAKRLTKLPQVDEAFRTGRLSSSQASEISATAIASPSSERDLLQAATTESLSGLRETCRRTRAAALPNEIERNEAIRRSRYFRSHTSADGAFEASMRLTPLDGARFMNALKPFQKMVFDNARRTGVREPFDAQAADAVLAMAETHTRPITRTAGTPPTSAPMRTHAPAPTLAGEPAHPPAGASTTQHRPGNRNDPATADPAPGVGQAARAESGTVQPP